jgi:hypothetical protein
MLGIGLIANDITRELADAREYSINWAVAGNDPRSQVEATLKYRENLANSAAFISRLVEIGDDPLGAGEAGVRAQLNASKLQDTRTARMAARQEMGIRGRDELAIARAGQTSPYESRVAEETARFAAEGRAIASGKEASGKQFEEQITAETARYKADRNAKFQALFRARPGVATAALVAAGLFSDQVDSKEQGVLSGMRAERTQKDKEWDALNTASSQAHAIRVSEMERSEGYRRLGVSTEALAQTRVSGFIIAHDIQAARVAQAEGKREMDNLRSEEQRDPLLLRWQVNRQGLAAVDAAKAENIRELDLATQGAMGAAAVNRALLARRPMQAMRRALDIQFQQAVLQGGAAAAEGTPLFDALKDSRDTEEMKMTMQDADEKRYLRMELTGEAKALSYLNRDVPSPTGARAITIASHAIGQAQRLYDREDPNNAAQKIQNAIVEEQVIKRQFYQQAQPFAADPRLVASGADQSRGGDDLETVNKALTEAIQDLTRMLTANGGFPATTTP